MVPNGHPVSVRVVPGKGWAFSHSRHWVLGGDVSYELGTPVVVLIGTTRVHSIYPMGHTLVQSVQCRKSARHLVICEALRIDSRSHGGHVDFAASYSRRWDGF